MIFVTTGSTALSSSMKEVITILDNAKKDNLINDEIIAQIGNIDYKPKFIDQYFDFTDDINKYFVNAEIVITADGAGTIFDLLTKNKRIIVVVNKDAQRYGANAEHFIGNLSDNKFLIWCKDISNLIESINIARNYIFRKYIQPNCSIAETINSFYLEWFNK